MPKYSKVYICIASFIILMGWVSSAVGVLEIPSVIRGVMRMWWVQAAYNPMTIIGVLILGTLFVQSAWEHGLFAKIARRLAPQRELSRWQRDKFIKSLRENGWSGEISIRHASHNEECKNYAESLGSGLLAAGSKPEIGITLDEYDDLFGLKLIIADMLDKPREAVIIAEALKSANVDFDWWPSNALGNTCILFVYPMKD